MKKSRFTEEQIVGILRETDRDPVATVAKRHGVSEQAIYTWKKRFGSFQPDDVRRLKQLEQENTRLKKLVAERDPRDRGDEGDRCKKCMTCPARARIEFVLTKAVRLNVSGLSRVDCCCSQAMMRSARFVPT